MSDERRLGKFAVSYSLIEKDWRALLPIFARCVVVRAEARFDLRSVEYTAFCEDFAPVPPNCEPPSYQFLCERRATGETSWRFVPGDYWSSHESAVAVAPEA